jgi:DNA-directed RNA polymerase specialized sigma24 family protein
VSTDADAASKPELGSPEESIERNLERLFETEAKSMERALVAYTGDWEIARDAVAEAFAQALASRTTLRSPRRWVWSVAFRVARGELKLRSQRRPLTDAGYDMREPPLHLIAALAKLSPNQRAALILLHYSGYRTREIAEILGSSPATVRVHLSQGRRRLVRLLEENDE